MGGGGKFTPYILPQKGRGKIMRVNLLPSKKSSPPLQIFYSFGKYIYQPENTRFLQSLGSSKVIGCSPKIPVSKVHQSPPKSPVLEKSSVPLVSPKFRFPKST